MSKITPNENALCAAEGFFTDGIAIGLKADNKKDMAFIHSETLCEVASTFTTNKMTAAPIRHFRKYGDFKTNFVLINAKNANAMTGAAGIDDINEVLDALKLKFTHLVNPIMSSTGVIGVRIPKQKILEGALSFDLSKKEPKNASEAIMTTDSFSKRIAFDIECESGTFSIGAMAKGAGMINPAMATMLCFITTDANVDASVIQEILDEQVKTTFNAASVDGDTSTNDTVLLLSNRKSTAFDKEAFAEALRRIMHFLALEMVRDGEGATKLVEYIITGAKDDKEAETAAKALSNSLLMKTALYGEDPNWGRVASTIGASGIECDEAGLTISFNDLVVYEKGNLLFDETMEIEAAKIMQTSEFTISCDIGIAKGEFTAYGCDLGHEYVKINADYRT